MNKEKQETKRKSQNEDQGVPELEDLMVQRDDDNNLLPEKVDTRIGTLWIVPISLGQQEKWASKLGTKATLEASEVAGIIREQIAKPDFSKLDGDSLTDIKFFVAQVLLEKILEVSGFKRTVSLREDYSARLEGGDKNPTKSS